MDIPFDLAGVLFIATANDISRLPGPLLNRLEMFLPLGSCQG
jgi:ATP-dependent Lon protease